MLSARASVDRLACNGNKLERDYAARLALRQSAGEVAEWGFQRLTLKLGHDTRYTPDFDYVDAKTRELVLVEVKGFMRDDARVKLYAAARAFPFRFVLATKEGGAWKEEPAKDN